MSISISSLTKTYGSQKAVDNISFTAPDTGIVGFLGPNGAGKSTTMKIITGYLKADSGSVLVDDIDVGTHALMAKKHIGYLPEGNPLYHEMYVREYLGFVASLHRLGRPAKRIEEVISMTGLSAESNKKTGQLSKGYKQRVGLAASLIHDPDVLVLDEPTSGLDPNQIVEIRQVIKNLGRNKTVLFSSHILQEVESICDRIIIIHRGRIVADDTLEHLQRPQNEAVVVVQFSGGVERGRMAAMEGIQSLEEEPGHCYRIRTADPDHVKKQILKLSLDSNVNIVSLQSEASSLEDVFRNLTGNIQNN